MYVHNFGIVRLLEVHKTQYGGWGGEECMEFSFGKYNSFFPTISLFSEFLSLKCLMQKCSCYLREILAFSSSNFRASQRWQEIQAASIIFEVSRIY